MGKTRKENELFHPIYQIELRQIEVKGLNARHYFWVLKKNLPGGGSRVLSQLHGGPMDPKTGEMKSFSLGGDQLKFFEIKGQKRFYNQSRKLPFAIAIQDHKENVMARWAEGVRAGNLVNKTRNFYDPWGTNSNTVANTVGRWMGYEVQRISDTRTDAAQPYVPGIDGDLTAGLTGQKVRRSPFIDNREPVGWSSLIRDKDGNQPEPNPFRDPFRTDIPF